MIPRLPTPYNHRSVTRWFAELQANGIVFDLQSSLSAQDGFTPDDAQYLNQTLDQLFDRYGDRVFDFAGENWRVQDCC